MEVHWLTLTPTSFPGLWGKIREYCLELQNKGQDVKLIKWDVMWHQRRWKFCIGMRQQFGILHVGIKILLWVFWSVEYLKRFCDYELNPEFGNPFVWGKKLLINYKLSWRLLEQPELHWSASLFLLVVLLLFPEILLIPVRECSHARCLAVCKLFDDYCLCYGLKKHSQPSV